MNPRVVQAKYMGGHKVWLEFSDGLAGEIDLFSEMWGEIFEPLRDPASFADFIVDKTLTWSNGADLAPEFLHELVTMTGATEAKAARAVG